MRKKAIKLIISIGLCIMTLPSMAFVKADQIDLSENLRAYYTFEEDYVEGKTVYNAANRDTYAGTLKGSNVTIKGSPFGKSLYFNDGNDSYMEIMNAINTGKEAYTISLWYLFDGAASRSVNTVLLQQNMNGRTLLFLTPDNTYGTYQNAMNVYSEHDVDIKAWQHVTMTCDPVQKKVAFYVNGVLDSEHDLGANSVDQLTSLIIGRHKNGGNDPQAMRGYMDEIRLYDKVVDNEEAIAIYNDKAGVLLQDSLQEKIDEAKTLYESNQVDSSADAAIQLQAAIQEALALNNPTVAQIQAMIEKLNLCMSAYRNAIYAVLTIDPNQVSRTLDSSVFGINHRYAFNGYGTFDTATGKVKSDFQDLYQQSAFGSIRYPGGTISNLFRWKDSLGTYDQRKKQIHGFYSAARGIVPNFGIGEIGTFANDNESEIVYVYGLGRGSAQDAADLIEYLNAKVGTNPNGGIDWAAIRAANGHSDPYNVRYFEIGNEMNQGGANGNGDGSWSQQYWTSYASNALDAYVNGANITYMKQPVVNEEDWNSDTANSNGKADQVKYMRYANPNPNPNPELNQDTKDFVHTQAYQGFKAVTDVHVYVNNVEWQIIDDLAAANANDQVVEVDDSIGTMTFGDGVHGMIPAKGAAIKVSYTTEKDGFVDISKAMKETMDQINSIEHSDQSVQVYTSWQGLDFINKMNNQKLNDWYDGMTVHPYSGTPTGSNADAFYDSAMKLAMTNGIEEVEKYVNAMPEDKVPVISEYGIFRSTDAQVRSQTHALYIAKVMMEYVRLGSPYIQKHCLVDYYSSGADSLGPTQQAVIQAVAQNGAVNGEGEYKFFSTPSASVFQMINTFYGNQILSSSINHMPDLGNGVDLYSTMTSKDKEGNMYVALVNLDKTSNRKITINVEGINLQHKIVDVQSLAGDSITAENTLETPDNVAIETSQFTSESNHITYEMAPHSFTILKINQALKEDINKKALQVLVDEYKDLDMNDYKEGVEEFNEALTNALSVLANDNVSQDTVDRAVQQLQDAIDHLVLKDSEDTTFTKTLLLNAINKANAAEESGQLTYLAPSVKKLILDARDAAVKVYDDETATIAQVMEAWMNLADAMHYMDFVANKEALQTLVDTNKDLDMNDYKEGVEAFNTALANAKAVLADDKALQARIDEAYKQLYDAVQGLVEKDKVSKEYLDMIVTSIKEHVGDGSKYKKDANWNTFVEALSAAENVLADDNATQEDVEKALSALTGAYEDIRLEPTEDQLDELNSFVDKAGSINRSLYTNAQLKQIDTLVAEAKNMLKDFDSEKYGSLLKDMEDTGKLIDKVENKTPSKPANPSKPSINGDAGTIKPSANPDTSDATNMAGILLTALLSGCSLYMMRRKYKNIR